MSDERDPKDAPPKPPEAAGDEDAVARALVKRALGKKSPSEEVLSREEGEKETETIDQGDAFELDEVDLKDALRGALQPPPGAVAPNLLRGVQRRLRIRSRGKFYGDGWSTAESPKTTYLITAILMLVVLAILFFALVPVGPGALP